MNSISVKVINQLKDNYSFILSNQSKDACVIDPADSYPIIEYVNKYSLKIKDIFITHHHKDHTAGIEGITKNFPNVNILSPSSHIEYTRFVYVMMIKLKQQLTLLRLFQHQDIL